MTNIGKKHTSQGAASPVSGKTIIFWANARFFGQKPAAKNVTKYFFVFINGKIWNRR